MLKSEVGHHLTDYPKTRKLSSRGEIPYAAGNTAVKELRSFPSILAAVYDTGYYYV